MQNELMGLDSILNQIGEIRTQVSGGTPEAIASNPLSNRAAGGVNFADVIAGAVHSVDAQTKDAAAKMTAVDMGKSDDLVGAMIAGQKASLSFAAMVQVRNNLMSAYDDVMKMPV